MITIDEKARKRFESDWLEGNSLSIRDYLPPKDRGSYLGTLEELVCIDLEFRWRPLSSDASESNQTISAGQLVVQTRVEDYIREFPELNDSEIIQRLVEQEIYVRVHAGYVVEPSEYQSRFPDFTIDESLFTEAGDAETKIQETTTPAAKSDWVQFPQQFGSYTLLSLLGKGGMGSVYRARHETMDREVALKIADTDSLSPQGRVHLLQRFESEGRTAASVAHDHIVPIFDVGNVEGRPFIAMQLVGGGDLSGMSKAEPLQSKRAAKYIEGVAGALAQAHAKDLLHRDIKPANILLDAKTDRAMLTDFGLARFRETDSGMTRTGQLLGTPSFMPPEQIKDSSRIDHRADIYALGGTLYQLLTGKPPFKAADMHETLRQVVSTEALAPRTLNADIDRDIDTICLKCLEKDPDARYQSAEELSRDLSLYLEGKPIVARPASLPRKLAKWCKRNPAIAAAQAFVLLAGFTVLTVVTVAWWTTDAAYRKVEVEQSRAVLARDEYQGSIRRLYVLFRDEPMLSAPGFEHVRKGFLDATLPRFELFVQTFADDPELEEDLAFAKAAIAEMNSELAPGTAKAKESIEHALTAISTLSKESRSKPTMLEAESNMLLANGQLLFREGKLTEALENFKASTALRTQWKEKDRKSVEANRKLANALMNEGICRSSLAKQLAFDQKAAEANEMLAVAEANYFDAQKIRLVLLKDQDPQGIPRVRRDFARAEFNLAFLELNKGNLDAAVDRLSSSASALEQLMAELQNDARLWQDFVKTRIYLGDLTSSQRNISADSEEFGKASRLTFEALEDVKALIQLRFRNPEFQLSLLNLYQMGLNSLISMDNLTAARDQLGHFQELVDSTPFSLSPENTETLPKDQLLLVLNFHKHKALIAQRLDAQAVALKVVGDAIGLYESNMELVSGSPSISADLGYLHAAQAALLANQPE